MEQLKYLSPEQELRLECMRIGVGLASAVIQSGQNATINLSDIADEIFEYTLHGQSLAEEENCNH